MLRRAAIIAFVLFVMPGCGSQVRVSSVSHDGEHPEAERRLTPEELAPALDALCQRVVQQIATTCERIDAANRVNAIQRQTLIWRIRATEVTATCWNRDNRVIGMIELWFWTASMKAYFGPEGEGAAYFGPGQPEALECLAKITDECEQLVKRTVPERGFDELRQRVINSSGKGELFSATAEQSRSMLKSMVDASHLEGLLSLPLAPFTALKGIGTGSDAVAELVVVAQQAVNLAERYPQLLTWNAQLAVLGVEEQETVRDMRNDLHRLVDIADKMPARLREETATLLADSSARETLKQAEGTANALTRLSESIDKLLARIDQMNTRPPDPATANAEPGRPFDIRDYEAALKAAEKTARETQSVILAASGAMGQPQVINAANSTAERLERATNRLFMWTMVTLIALGGVVAGLITMHHMMDLNKIRKTQRFENIALTPKKKPDDKI